MKPELPPLWKPSPTPAVIVTDGKESAINEWDLCELDEALQVAAQIGATNVREDTRLDQGNQSIDYRGDIRRRYVADYGGDVLPISNVVNRRKLLQSTIDLNYNARPGYKAIVTFNFALKDWLITGWEPLPLPDPSGNIAPPVVTDREFPHVTDREILVEIVKSVGSAATLNGWRARKG